MTILPRTRTNFNTKDYATRCKQVGSNLGIPVIDLWTGMQGNQSEMIIDGLHLNTSGDNYVYNLLKLSIASNYPELARDNIALDLS
ncbi:hypothetical protein THRCLA_22455 [Thraustotheca clavata]|uniref:SGNH hydrolase-type esterase domain-containing protein n=1 Tax=Thraustotheca clavata TaxID=74557 RepID=A0A1V9Z0G0_9STRA|nr:hypothetical protein THRCLA_22455 [Thraustotheca clavata]